jgi:hypothetical protein
LWYDSSSKGTDNTEAVDTACGTEHLTCELGNYILNQAERNSEVDSRSVPHVNGRQEADRDTTDCSIKLSAGYQVNEHAWPSVQQAEGTEDSERRTELGSVISAPITETSLKEKSINVEATYAMIHKPNPIHSDYIVKHKPQCEPSSGKRSRSSIIDVPDAKLSAGKASRNSLPGLSGDAIQNVSQFGFSEDYLRLMAHIFNCIFR